MWLEIGILVAVIALAGSSRALTKAAHMPHFKISEFEREGYKVPANLLPNLHQLIEQLEIIREHAGKPIRVTSGYARSGHVQNSRHYTAQAADFHIQGMKDRDAWDLVKSLMLSGRIIHGGLGWYGEGHSIHYDTGPARYWDWT